MTQPIVGYWDHWIFTDKMSLVVRSHYGPNWVYRNKHEKYHPDCTNRKRQGETTIMFWGSMIYGVPLCESPIYIWEVETVAKKEPVTIMLAAENQLLVDKANQLRVESEEALKSNPFLLVVGKSRGRPKNNFKVKKKEQSKKRKGGIDWFQYRENVANPLLYPFYRTHEERISQLDDSGTAIIFIEDGAGAHCSENLNAHHRENGINKAIWPACKFFLYLLYNQNTNHFAFIASPDFNLIEKVCDIIQEKLSFRKAFPNTKEATKRAWVEEWNKISVETSNSLIEALPRKLRQCVAAKGGNSFHG